MGHSETVRVTTDLEVEVEHLRPVGERGARIDVKADDGRKWRLDVSKSGQIDIVTTWENNVLADLDLPGWMDHVAASIGRAA